MRALIIGCGYVGLPLGADLVRRGHNVFGLRRSASAKAELKAAGITPLVADITKPKTLADLPRDFDWVVNCVASGGGTAEDYRAVYLQGTLNVLEWLSTLDPRPSANLKKFVYTSSTSVYGQTDGSVVDESSPTEPLAETSQVLLATENVLLGAARQRNFPAVILRVAGIYGPGRGHWFKQFLKGEARIDGDGGRWLNMIHRDDVVGAIITALERGQPSEIYNAVDDEPVTQVKFFEWLARKLGRDLPPRVAENAQRKRGATNKRVSNRRLKTELGYEFRYPTFREGCAHEFQ
jgi:nucleoside-diphosphate-sugar epimerase